jgi:heme/copper-type cytochrome/quinol oxidase subunit 1
MAEIETEAPPVGEEVHMPEPSILPVANAVGLTLALVGITLSLVVTVIGALIFVTTLVAWIRAASREMSELPLDHSSH